MKKSIITTLAAAIALAFGCTPESSLNPLEGIYPDPVVTNLTNAEIVSVEKAGDLHNFILKFTGSGDELVLKVASNKWYLIPTTYNAVHQGELVKGTYSMEESTCNGKKLAEKGMLVVTGENMDYAMKGHIWAEDGTVFKIDWAGRLEFEPDPEPVKLSKVLSVQNNNTQGTASLTLKLASANVNSTYDAATWTTIYTGNGNFLALDIYSADGKLHPGTYTASAAGGQIGEGQFGIGWDPGDLFGIGMVFTNWGTCWWTVEDGATSAQHIASGEIEVALKGTTYTITYKEPGKADKDAIWFEFKGAIEDVVPEAEGPVDTFDGEELNTLISAADYSIYGGSITLMFGDGNVSVNESQEWSGTGNYLAMDIKSLTPGTYKACAEGGNLGDGEFGIGYDQEWSWGGMSGVNYDYGTCWWTVSDGERSAQKVLDGTVTVALDGETYTITLESSVVNARYVGPITL